MFKIQFETSLNILFICGFFFFFFCNLKKKFKHHYIKIKVQNNYNRIFCNVTEPDSITLWSVDYRVFRETKGWFLGISHAIPVFTKNQHGVKSSLC